MSGNSVETMSRQSGAVKSAERSLALLEYLAGAGTAGWADIIRDVRLPRSSAHALLQTLLSSGWVTHDPKTREYALGIRAWQVGNAFRGPKSAAELVTPLMKRLRDELNETVQLAQLDGEDVVYLAIEEPDRPMRLASSVGARLSSHATGLGKVLLGLLPDSELDMRLERINYAMLTPRTVPDAVSLREQVLRARADGFAVDDEEYMSGCRCVAVPLHIGDDPTRYALSVTMPTSRTGPDWPRDLVAHLADEVTTLA